MIPQILIARLKNLGPHFIRVAKQGKAPIDKGWTNNPLNADDIKLLEWLKQGGNYGVIGGFGIVIVDVDLDSLKQIVKENLPETFTVQSPGSKGWHLYLLCSLEKPIRLRDQDGDNIGDIQGQGKMVVGPGSIHPNGGVYKIIIDKPLAQVTREQLIEVFKEFVVPDREIEIVKATARRERKETNIDLSITQVVPLRGLQNRGSWYQGSHPIHGSEGGQNFTVHPNENYWHCFRCESGGGPLLWLAVQEGIISCAEAGAGALRGEIFKKVLRIAIEQGYISEEKANLKRYGTSMSLGDFYLEKKGTKVFLFNKDAQVITSCNVESVDGFHFRRKLHDITKLEETEIDRVTAAFQLSIQGSKQEVAEPSGEPEGEELDAEVEKEADHILDSPDILESLQPHLDNIIVGEDANKKLEFILLLSGKIEDYSLKQMLALKGEPGGGKSHLMKLANAFKTKRVGRFTAHALDYSDLENFEILLLQELGVMDEEFQGVSTIKFLSVDDMGYTVEVPVKDEEGRWSTEQYKIPPITVITSTTRVNLDPQFERRAWLLNVDESEEQTKLIANWKAEYEREKDFVKLGLKKETSYNHSMKVIGAVVRKLQPVKVILAFPKSIINLLGTSKLRLRGDYDKFFTLIRLHTFLHQRTADTMVNDKGERVILTNPAKALEILKIAEEVYQTMVGGLEKRTRKLIETLEDLKITYKGAAVDLDRRGDIAAKLGISDHSIYRYLNEWHRKGYMTKQKTRARGNPIEFKLMFPLTEIKQKTTVTFFTSENQTVDCLKLQKEADSLVTLLSSRGFHGMSADKLLSPEIPETREERQVTEDSAPVGEKEQTTFAVSPRDKVTERLEVEKQETIVLGDRRAPVEQRREKTTREIIDQMRDKLPLVFKKDKAMKICTATGRPEKDCELMLISMEEEKLIVELPQLGWFQWVR